jgi:hypothetical protein
MLFMIVERFKNRDAVPVYRRFREQGRMMPEGLKYIDSWTAKEFDQCFQLMECEDSKLIDQWIAHWQDLVDFEIVPVVSSAEAATAISERG